MAEKTSIPIETKKSQPIPKNIREWFEEQMQAKGLDYLLAMTDEGVVWGRLVNNRLVTAEGTRHQETVIVPHLHAETFQEARLFGVEGEIYVWRIDDASWAVRRIFDQGYPLEDYYEEEYFVWGEATEPQSDLPEGFRLMRDGAQEMFHVMPHTVSRSANLVVRHYLQDDETGFTRIALSRLVDLKERTS